MSKVYYLIDHFKDPYAGTEGQLYALIKALVAQKKRIEVGVFRDSEYIQSGQFPCPVEVLGITKMFSPVAFFKLVQLGFYLRKNNFKLVHIFFNDASVIAPIVLKCFGIKVIISRRDMGFWYTDTLKKILRFNASFVDGCICNSEAVKQITVESEGYKPDQVHVVYNGLPPHKLTEGSTENTHTADAAATNTDDKKIIGIVANIRPVKRMQDLVNAFAIVKKTVKHAQLVIVGDGDNTALLQQATQLGVADSINFAGAQKDVAKYITQFDVAALTSESEGLSNAIIEYMVYGKPVVCSRVGGNPELIEQGTNGLLYDVADVDQLAAHLTQLLTDPKLSEAYGRNGRAKVEKEFSIQQMVSNTLSIYSKYGYSVGQNQ
ncbi:glycosyltransferase [Alkalimarinus alittae]|uniref:Glycosyltransferase n=1 Tax=Alkalimarinus alittae TaxID=2961619 RepID=A0ABY6N7J5_9ALTE|nr:glycosyltransferase [Alkalimarinus alittae]UZE97967.1 glycosyltransferase [Alkalimarinus alittae]